MWTVQYRSDEFKDHVLWWRHYHENLIWLQSVAITINTALQESPSVSWPLQVTRPGLFPRLTNQVFLTASHAIAFLKKKKRKTIEFCHRLVTEALVKKFVAGHSCVQYLLFTDGREPSGNLREGWKPGIKAELTWGQGDGGGIHLWEWNSDTLQTAPCILYHCLWQLKHCLMWKACWLRVRFHCPLAWG